MAHLTCAGPLRCYVCFDGWNNQIRRLDAIEACKCTSWRHWNNVFRSWYFEDGSEMENSLGPWNL